MTMTNKVGATTFSMPSDCEIDLRPGGSWRFLSPGPTCTSLYPSKEARDAVLKTRMQDGASESLDRLDEHLSTGA